MARLTAFRTSCYAAREDAMPAAPSAAKPVSGYNTAAAPNGAYDPMAGEDRAQGRIYHIARWHKWPDQRKVKMLRRMAEDYGADPNLRWHTAKVLERYGAAPRDYPAQAAALLKYVQNEFYYTNEANEQIQSPWATIRERTGDCFAAGTLVLRDDYELVPVEHVKAGTRIWGYDRWSVVEAWADKGSLPIVEVALNNGSTLRLTADHKLWVRSCALHGPDCADLVDSGQNCQRAGRTFTWEVRRVCEVKPRWVLKQPDRIMCGGRDEDPDLAWLDGVYLADGWSDDYRCSISGQDGKPKEAQKRRVSSIVERYGETVRWHRKYVSLHAGPLVQRLMAHGASAKHKRILGLDRSVRALHALDEGLQADASRNTCGVGWTLGTINRTIAVQYRVLQRLLGRSTAWKCVADHGGLGTNPIYRVNVRMGKRDKILRVKSVAATGEVGQCFDIETDDKHVYLPEADCTVHNCDDLGVLLASMAESIALPWRFALGGMRQIDPSRDPRMREYVRQCRAKLADPAAPAQHKAEATRWMQQAAVQRVRWIEGQPWPRGTRFSHIYIMLGWPPFSPEQWAAAEPTVRGLPLGHDVVLNGLPSGVNGGRDLGSWGAATADGSMLKLPIVKFAGTGAFGSTADVIEAEYVEGGDEMFTWQKPGEGVFAAFWRHLDKPGLVNSVVQGVITSVAVGATAYWLAKNTKLRV